MPSSMIHLLTARYSNFSDDTAYFIGSVAPDCIEKREIKDRNHLRLYPDSERLNALRRYAGEFDLNVPFHRGVILHLFTDYMWDTTAQRHHHEAYSGNNWFSDYRNEISLASVFMFSHCSWGRELFDKMYSCPRELYSLNPDFPPDDIFEYISRNKSYHETHDCPPSSAFPPDFINSFCHNTAVEFDSAIFT